jgi:hypothetical protein
MIAPANPGHLEIGDEAVRPNATWLRRTEYLGTDLYDAVHKVRVIFTTLLHVTVTVRYDFCCYSSRTRYQGFKGSL